MTQPYPELFDSAPLFGEIIDLTSQMQAAGFDALMSQWESGFDFFANLLKHAEEVTNRSNALLMGVVE